MAPQLASISDAHTARSGFSVMLTDSWLQPNTLAVAAPGYSQPRS